MRYKFLCSDNWSRTRVMSSRPPQSRPHSLLFCLRCWFLCLFCLRWTANLILDGAPPPYWTAELTNFLKKSWRIFPSKSQSPTFCGSSRKLVCCSVKREKSSFLWRRFLLMNVIINCFVFLRATTHTSTRRVLSEGQENNCAPLDSHPHQLRIISGNTEPFQGWT